MSRSTPSTAESQLVGRPTRSRSTGKRFVSARTETSGAGSAEGCGVVAAELTVSLDRSEFGVGLDAPRNAVRAARVEATAGRELPELGNAARNDGQLAA